MHNPGISAQFPLLIRTRQKSADGFYPDHPPDQALLQFWQLNLPFLCRKSSCSTRLLGRLNQCTDLCSRQLTLVLNMLDSLRDVATMKPRNQKQSTPVMAVTVQKARCFIWSTCFLSRSLSPGPGRIRARRTEKLQKETMTKEKTRKQKNWMTGSLG